MKQLLILLLLTFSLSAFSQDANQLMVKVTNIKSEKGKIMLGLFNDPEKFLDREFKASEVTINGETVEVTFEGIPDGEYAISIFHDENDNGELDSNILGIPTEPYGFSNNAKGRFGPPSYRDCLFEVKNGSKEITITL